MTRHVLHTADTADVAARETLIAVEKMIGFLPNIFAVLGDTPNTLNALVSLNTQFGDGQLTAIEREIVQLAVSVENGCGYCVAGHSAFAISVGMSKREVAALRSNRPLVVPREEALRQFARTLAADKGHGAEAAYTAFLKAGFTARQARDVILGVSMKTLTNTLSVLLDLPLDDSFKPYAWLPEDAAGLADAA